MVTADYQISLLGFGNLDHFHQIILAYKVITVNKGYILPPIFCNPTLRAAAIPALVCVITIKSLVNFGIFSRNLIGLIN